MKKGLTKILSIDWDYFFPNTFEFDWGHNESPIFYEFAWTYRVGSTGLLSGERALDKMVPDKKALAGFWNNFNMDRPVSLIIAESHADLYKFISAIGFPNIEVWNFDAHHDLGYSQEENVKDCGTWARDLILDGKMKRFNQFYPQWRKKDKDNVSQIDKKIMQKTKFNYGLKDLSEIEFDIIFICRSSCWTPPWSDNEWMAFIQELENARPDLWKFKTIVEFVSKPRDFDMEKAKKDAEEMRQSMKDAHKLLREAIK